MADKQTLQLFKSFSIIKQFLFFSPKLLTEGFGLGFGGFVL